MSRTFRRKGDKKRFKSGHSHFESDYIVERDPNSECAGRAAPLVKMTGVEYWQSYWKFHGDSQPGYGWANSKYDRVRFEAKCRMKNKTEISRYLKCEEHEVFTHKPGCLSYER